MNKSCEFNKFINLIKGDTRSSVNWILMMAKSPVARSPRVEPCHIALNSFQVGHLIFLILFLKNTKSILKNKNHLLGLLHCSCTTSLQAWCKCEEFRGIRRRIYRRFSEVLPAREGWAGWGKSPWIWDTTRGSHSPSAERFYRVWSLSLVKKEEERIFKKIMI